MPKRKEDDNDNDLKLNKIRTIERDGATKNGQLNEKEFG